MKTNDQRVKASTGIVGVAIKERVVDLLSEAAVALGDLGAFPCFRATPKKPMCIESSADAMCASCAALSHVQSAQRCVDRSIRMGSIVGPVSK
jgi:hypothetical protein